MRSCCRCRAWLRRGRDGGWSWLVVLRRRSAGWGIRNRIGAGSDGVAVGHGARDVRRILRGRLARGSAASSDGEDQRGREQQLWFHDRSACNKRTSEWAAVAWQTVSVGGGAQETMYAS